MSEAVGACILSWGDLWGAVGDAAEVEYFLEKIDAELYSNSLTNGCGFPGSLQVLEEVLLPFFMENFSEHLLIGIFHSEEDGSWILAGKTTLCFWDIAKTWKKAKKFGACQHLRIVAESCYSGWWGFFEETKRIDQERERESVPAQHAAQYGCPSISVQAACGTGGDLCKTPDDRDGFTFTSFWVYKQTEWRDKLEGNEDFRAYKANEKLVEERRACYWCAHGGNSAAASFLKHPGATTFPQWAYVGKRADAAGGEAPVTETRPFLEKLLGEDLDDKDMVACLKSYVEQYTANLRKPRHFLIVCDGNIGCGKTTFLDEIDNSRHFPSDVKIFREPVAQHAPRSWWSLLEKFYEEMKNGHGPDGPTAVIELENTTWAHHSKIATQRELDAITERCCNSSVQVFCKALKENGTLPASVFKKLMADLRQMNADVAHEPTLVLYFRLPVEEAMRRIQRRAEREGRKFEKGITKEYLEQLESLYEKLYYEDREDVIRIDSNGPQDEIKREVADKLEENAARFHRVLQRKGFSEAEAKELLMRMIRCFRPED